MKRLFKIGSVLLAGLLVMAAYEFRSDILGAVQSPAKPAEAALIYEIPQPVVTPEQTAHFMRMSRLNNCQSGYVFFARWASIAESFNQQNGNSAEITKASSEMYALAVQKNNALKKLILESLQKGVKAGINEQQLKMVGKSEFDKARVVLEQAFLLTSLAGPQKVTEFFKGIIMGDYGCRKLVADVIADKDLEPGYYDPPEEIKGEEVSHRIQK